MTLRNSHQGERRPYGRYAGAIIFSLALHAVPAAALLYALGYLSPGSDERIYPAEIVPSLESRAPGTTESREAGSTNQIAAPAPERISGLQLPLSRLDGSRLKEPKAKQIQNSKRLLPRSAAAPQSPRNPNFKILSPQAQLVDRGVPGNSGSSGGQRALEVSASYRQVVMAKLERVKRYPRRALERGERGTAILFLNIDATGGIIESAIVQTSNVTAFDEEVLAMVRRAGPFPPLPSELGQASFETRIPIEFKIE